MPLHIIRQDITKIACDAIVNAANNALLGGGVDGAIHKAAGPILLEECRKIGGCETGDAKITKGYRLPCKYIIHTVGPIWHGGMFGERILLESCYKKSLALALENGCESIAFPLISAGVYGYPKDKALSIAIESISDFLFTNEMTVFLVVFDKKSFQISEELFENVAEYIDDNYVFENEDLYFERQRIIDSRYNKSIQKCSESSFSLDSHNSLEEMLSKMDDNFTVTLLKLIDIKGITDVDCYKKANVSKQTWYKIMNDEKYKPSKNTVIAFAISLELSFEETQRLLSTVGFALSNSNKFDIIISYFLHNEIYDIFLINETLFKFDQVCLGV